MKLFGWELMRSARVDAYEREMESERTARVEAEAAASNLAAKLNDAEQRLEGAELREQNIRDDARSAVHKLRRQRVRRIPEHTLPDKEVVQILGGLGESPAWAALHQELDAAIMDAIDDVSLPPDPNKPALSRDFAAGGVDYLRKFQARLIDIGQQVQVKDADLE